MDVYVCIHTTFIFIYKVFLLGRVMRRSVVRRGPAVRGARRARALRVRRRVPARRAGLRQRRQDVPLAVPAAAPRVPPPRQASVAGLHGTLSR